ncbi:MAG: RdgB/HAM1 family non-canonical purine NTP pyrophosphatase [Oscillospiraceae bacterium]|nr:RdgB/HAM1 family non-canonical purine NTP pyrophosphatase [Oscillospiraceae bacterium]
MKLILATNNQNKLREIRGILAETGIEVVSQREAGYDFDADETGTTFAENAQIKAEALWNAAAEKGERCFVLADDSGLSVDALNGEPGVYSHRWAGENATDSDRIAKLLSALQDVPDENRGAHFSCAMCLMTPDGILHHFEGRAEGSILREPRGENGFGYDPVFDRNGRSFAEIPAEEKNAVSHRHNALMQVLAFFRENGCRSEGDRIC